MSRMITRTYSLVAGSATAICASQKPGAAGLMTLTTAAGVTLDAGRRVQITSDGNDTGVTFTVSGTNNSGTPLIEALAGPNATSVSTTQDFKTVTSVRVSAATAGNITVGTSAVGSCPPIVFDGHGDAQVAVQADVISGSATYTVETTVSPLQLTAVSLAAPFATWFADPSLINKTAAAQAMLSVKPHAIRLTITAGTGTVRLSVVQAGKTGGC